MSNHPRRNRTKIRRTKHVPTLDVHVDPSRIREGHSVDLVGTDPWKIVCTCGSVFEGPRGDRDRLEKEAFEHVYDTST